MQSRTSDNMKGHQRAERKIKELQFQNDEDHKNQERMSELATKLQSKVTGWRNTYLRSLCRFKPSTESKLSAN